MNSPAPTQAYRKRRNVVFLCVIALLIVLTLLAARWLEFRKLAAKTDLSLTQTVQVVHPQPGPAAVEISLPGSLEPFSKATLYARTNGYIKSWQTDLGAKLKPGQIMAEISAPDVDAQLDQAKANLVQSRAHLEITQLDFARQEALYSRQVTSRQEFEQSRAAWQQAAAEVQSAAANVSDLSVQQGFQKIVAPFPGVVTRRLIDVGDLVATGTGASSNGTRELFVVARTDILRLYVDVPQIYSRDVARGTKVTLTLEEFPGREFTGTVTNLAGALDGATRTLRTEIQVSNADGQLSAGAYTQVHLHLPVEPLPVIPANTLLFRSAGLQVGVVDEKGAVELRNITLGEDFGNTVQVTKGLATSDRVIVNPSDSLAAGQVVHVTPSSSDR